MAFAIFVVATAIVLVGALGVVLASNPVHSALSLVATLVGVALFFLQLGAHLVAAVQVVVYASAIVVLFVFVIMLLGVDRRERVADVRRPQTVAALVFGVLAAALLLVVVGGQWETTGIPSSRGALADPAPAAANPLDPTAPPTTGAGVAGVSDDPGNVETVARSIFEDFGWPLQLTAVLLTLAVVGAVILAKRSASGGAIDLVDADDAGASA